MCDLAVFADENNVDVVRLWHLTVGELCINLCNFSLKTN